MGAGDVVGNILRGGPAMEVTRDPLPAYVRHCLSQIKQVWAKAKDRQEETFSPAQVARLWRVIDHHDWWMIAKLVEQRCDAANTISYMLIVLEDDDNYDQFYKPPSSRASTTEEPDDAEGSLPTREEKKRAGRTSLIGPAVRSLRDHVRQ
jgi:hypothetical protein